MEVVGDEEDDYKEVQPSRSRWNNVIKHASFPHRRTTSRKPKTLKMIWKSTRAMRAKRTKKRLDLKRTNVHRGIISPIFCSLNRYATTLLDGVEPRSDRYEPD